MMKPNEDGYYDLGRKAVFAMLFSLLSHKKARLVRWAYKLSKYGHRTQSRADGKTRYFEHPKSVMLIMLIELGIRSWRHLVLGLLHDELEDSFQLDLEMVEFLFGKKVARALALLTKDPKEGYHKRLMLFGDEFSLTVKLVDRLHNMRTLHAVNKAKWMKQVNETREEYLPLADKLYSILPKKLRWRAEKIKAELVKLCDYYESAAAA